MIQHQTKTFRLNTSGTQTLLTYGAGYDLYLLCLPTLPILPLPVPTYLSGNLLVLGMAVRGVQKECIGASEAGKQRVFPQ